MPERGFLFSTYGSDFRWILFLGAKRQGAERFSAFHPLIFFLILSSN